MKYKVGDWFSQSWASFKDGSSFSFDLFELYKIEDDVYYFQSISSDEKITTDLGSFWKYDLIYLNKKKKNNIVLYYDKIKNKIEKMETIINILKN